MSSRSHKEPCPLCGVGFWGKHALAMHLKKAHHQCPHCPRSFIRLAMHLAKAHPCSILEVPES